MSATPALEPLVITALTATGVKKPLVTVETYPLFVHGMPIMKKFSILYRKRRAIFFPCALAPGIFPFLRIREVVIRVQGRIFI
jgi:hypothetical protein